MANNDFEYKESRLSASFCRDFHQKVTALIESSTTFTLVSMPAIGVSIYLRFLTLQPLAHFVYLDVFSLSNLTTQEFYRSLLYQLNSSLTETSEDNLLEKCQEELASLAKKHKKIVIVLNRFDQLESQFSQQFFANIRMLRHVAPDAVVFIFTANRPFVDTHPEAISGGNKAVFSEYVYFPPYTPSDLRSMLELHSKELVVIEKKLDQAIQACGGHFQLLQLILKSERENLLLDKFILLLFKEIYAKLQYAERKMLVKIADKKNVGEIDEYLLKTGIINQENQQSTIFSPLFADYVLDQSPIRLPVKEAKLFAALKKHLGQVVSKDELFTEIWGDEEELANDWSLNALVYRLRKNNSFKRSGYEIENYKKVGYVLVKK